MDFIPNRFDRIIAILIQLQSRKIVKAKELADRFGVTLRTIYRDIKTLDNAGVPIIGEAGVGYSIMDGYRLPPVMFSREEAGSFVAAEKLMSRFTDEKMSSFFATAMYKVKSVLRSDEKNMVEFLENQIDISSGPSGFNKNIPSALHQITESMATKKQLLIEYKAVKGVAIADRKIEAIGMFHENQFWYIYAWCHLRHDYRQFRIDRIIDLKITAESFSMDHPSLQELRSRDLQEEKTTVRIKIKKSAAPYLQSGKEYYGFVSEKSIGNDVIMHFECCNVERAFARWFMMFADFACILEPESLKTAVRQILDTAQKNVGDLSLPESRRFDA